MSNEYYGKLITEIQNATTFNAIEELLIETVESKNP